MRVFTRIPSRQGPRREFSGAPSRAGACCQEGSVQVDGVLYVGVHVRYVIDSLRPREPGRRRFRRERRGPNGLLTYMLEDPAGLAEVRDKGDDAHLGTAILTAEGIHFEDTADEPRPGRGRFPVGRGFPVLYEDKFRFLIFLVFPPLFPPVARTVNTVVKGQALIRRRDMGGQKGQKLAKQTNINRDLERKVAPGISSLTHLYDPGTKALPLSNPDRHGESGPAKGNDDLRMICLQLNLTSPFFVPSSIPRGLRDSCPSTNPASPPRPRPAAP